MNPKVPDAIRLDAHMEPEPHIAGNLAVRLYTIRSLREPPVKLWAMPAGDRPLKGGFAAAYGDALRAPLTGRSPPCLGSASGLSRIRRVPRLRLNRSL